MTDPTENTDFFLLSWGTEGNKFTHSSLGNTNTALVKIISKDFYFHVSPKTWWLGIMATILLGFDVMLRWCQNQAKIL